MYSQQHKAPCPYIHTSLHLLLTYMQEGRGGDVQEQVLMHAHQIAACCSQAPSGKGGKGAAWYKATQCDTECVSIMLTACHRLMQTVSFERGKTHRPSSMRKLKQTCTQPPHSQSWHSLKRQTSAHHKSLLPALRAAMYTCIACACCIQKMPLCVLPSFDVKKAQKLRNKCFWRELLLCKHVCTPDACWLSLHVVCSYRDKLQWLMVAQQGKK